MRNVNQVFITGFLGADPETRKAGTSTVTRFSVGVNQTWEDERGKQTKVNWIPVLAWNKRGETAAQYLHKGSHVHVQGALSVSSWEDKDTKQRRTKTEVVAFDIIFLDRKENGSEEVVPDLEQHEEYV